MRTDLHLHSDRSDGWDHPDALLADLRRRRLSWWSICDHDTVRAYDDLRTVDADLSGLIPGVELSVSHEGQEIHILALGIDVDAPDLRRLLAAQQDVRRRRIVAIIESLKRRCGWELERAQIIPERSDSPSRSHLALALLRAGLVPHMTAAFADLLSADSLIALDLEPFIPVSEALACMRALGAVCLLAHPCTLPTNEAVNRVMDLGLDGLELRCPSLDAAREQHLLELVRDRDLLISAGSDHHGSAPGQALRACHIGDWRMNGREVDRLLAALRDDG